MLTVNCQLLTFGSVLQKKSIELRYEVLRKPLGLYYTPEQLAAEANQMHFAAICDNKVVGILLIEKLSDTECKMRQVAIATELQNKGIGKKLVVFAEQELEKMGINSIILHARDTAIPFYLSLNYSIISDTFYEVGIPHKKMSKKFNFSLDNSVKFI